MDDLIDRQKAIAILQRMADARCQCSHQQIIEKKTLEMAILALKMMEGADREERQSEL